jgi:agmatinase
MAALQYRKQEDGFLGLSVAEEPGAPEAAKAVVIPFGLEATVCFGSGTARGPQAIIAASPQLDYFLEELWCEPYRQYGIATLVPGPVAADHETALAQIEGLVESVLAEGKFPLVLGGEHSLTIGAIKPFLRRYPDLIIVQIDAHADLRDGYLGERLSHASTMRRILETSSASLVSIGIRCISAEEIAYYEAERARITIHFAKDRKSWRMEEMMEPLRGRPVYLSFDVDGLDASLMPATGTPEPGGLFFDDACEILRAVAWGARVVGADIVELAPMPNYHAADYTTAKLAYKLLSYVLAKPQP